MGEKIEKFNETDMYLPLKTFFTSLGYQVNGEVRNCDITLLKDDRLIIVELKKTFNLALLYQALNRQKMSDEVYVAIPRVKRAKGSGYNDIINIIKRLGLGLITVAMDSPVKTVEILVFPTFPHGVKMNKANMAKRDKIINEISSRTFDMNLGGSAKKKLITAYREKAIKIACVLENRGPVTAGELIRLYGCDKSAYAILRSNTYGWFEKIPDAGFSLSEAGKRDLNCEQFKQIVDYYRHETETTHE